VTDQQGADHAGIGGNPMVQTPNLDALPARGAGFERADVANPICMPNRCSILTGRGPEAFRPADYVAGESLALCSTR
jgi:arylsulfatase A-like enzyme